MVLKKSRSVRSKVIMPAIVFAAGVALSLGLGYLTHREIMRSAQQRFDSLALLLANDVEDRFDAYTGVLAGLRALFKTSETVSRQQFRQYVAGLDLSTDFPGFQALNYAPHVLAADKHGFEERLRNDTSLAPDVAKTLSIAPAGERSDYHPLTLIEPLDGNEAVLGRDLDTNPKTREALQRARDSGRVTSSGRMIPINGRKADVGLAMRLPVYRADLPQDTVEARRAAYLGSVGAGFRMAGMMRDLLASDAAAGARLRLFDGGPMQDDVRTHAQGTVAAANLIAEGNPLFDSAKADTVGAAQADDRATAHDTFERTLAFHLGGRAWVVHVSKDAALVLGGLGRIGPWLIVLCGIAISSLLAGIVYSLTTARSRAEAIARVMTRHLRTSERQLEEAQHLASLGSWMLDTETGILSCSDEARRILGFDAGPPQPALATLLARVPPDERATVERHIAQASQSGERIEFEHRLVLPDGTERWVHVIAQVAEENGKTALRGTVRDDTQRRKGALRLRLEHDVAQWLVNDGEPEQVISRALESACRHLGWDCASVWAVGEDGVARCGSSWHAGDDAAIDQFVKISRSLGYRPDEGSLGRAWAGGAALRLDTLSTRHDFTRDALAGRAGLAAGLIVPMTAAGSVTALEFFSRAPRAIDADMIDSLRAIALQIEQYAQRKRAEKVLRYVASHDALTGLANRSTLQRDLARAIQRGDRHQKRFAVMFVDLDSFKRINDTLGHGVGDALIKACGERLATTLREADAVARFGGDEFVLVVEDLSQASDAGAVAEKVLACCAEPFVIGDRELHVTASIGVSIYPEDGADGETLLKNADTAMYRAKDKGRGSFQFYAAQMNAQGSERLMLETGLRRALERGELQMHYQPKMNLHTRRIVGVEALMRWRHPRLGLVSPAEFIPIAEETGLIVPMGKWALEAACADARDWQRRGLPPVQMSVNLSPRQLISPTLIADIAQVLATSGLDPALLELEITEGVMMKNPEQASVLLQEIRDMGVGLAIDDFGTGYSSLSYLKRFPLSTVKIDRTFVNDLSTDPDAQALTSGIITLAHGLRLKVVAEGVETAEQLSYLRSHHCDEIQGYWLCKPLPAEEACKFMARHLRNLCVEPVAA